MRLVVFGATGRVGRSVVERALVKGHEVVAFARHPEAVAQADGLSVVAGDARDPEAVVAALEGADAVISVMGAKTLDPTTELSDATAGVIEGMEEHGPKRLIVLSHVGVFLKKVDPQYRHVVAEHRRNLEALQGSGLDWTAVGPPGIVGAPATGKVEARAGARGPEWSIARGDLVEFMLDQLETDAFMRQAVGVSGSTE